MRIGNSYDYTQLYNDYSNLRIRDSLAEVKAPQENGSDVNAAEQVKAEQAQSPESAAKRERLLGLEDISLTFNKNDDFDIIGKTSDITGLDLQKAVSISKRDDILSDYKTAESAVPVYAGEEGTVIAK